MPSAVLSLPTLDRQADRLVELGVHRLAGLSEPGLRAMVTAARPEGDALLVLDHRLVAASQLVPLLEVRGRAAFVVEDMSDVDAFLPVQGAEPPEAPAYLLRGLDRGDDLANWSPNEADAELANRGRTPMTLTEGLHWLLQVPDVLERNRCFMTTGSRLTKPNGALDARTPALWISNGTGRDGSERRHAPKVGWCWAGNRHTWLGFASAAGRSGLSG